MLKYLLFMVFLFPVGFMGKMWWVLQFFLFVAFFLLIFSGCFMVQPWCLGYNFCFDNLSYFFSFVECMDCYFDTYG